MGIDTTLFVRPEIRAEEIMVALKALGIEDVEYQATHTPSYATILFKSTIPGKYKRKISFFYGVDEYFGMQMNMLSLGADEEAYDIIRMLGEMIGGVYRSSDCNNDCEYFDVPGNGNIRWLIERYFLENPEAPIEGDKQVEDFIAWNKQGDPS